MQAGARRAAGPGPRRRADRAATGWRSSTGAAAERGASGTTCSSPGRSAKHVALERDRARQGPADARHRRRADEPRRLGPARGREVRDACGEDAGARGSVVASDAFFPFADGPQAAIEAGVTAVIQPGGSKRDDEVIEACDDGRRRDGLHRPPPLPPLSAPSRRSRGSSRLHLIARERPRPPQYSRYCGGSASLPLAGDSLGTCIRASKSRH